MVSEGYEQTILTASISEFAVCTSKRIAGRPVFNAFYRSLRRFLQQQRCSICKILLTEKEYIPRVPTSLNCGCLCVPIYVCGYSWELRRGGDCLRCGLLRGENSESEDVEAFLGTRKEEVRSELRLVGSKRPRTDGPCD